MNRSQSYLWLWLLWSTLFPVNSALAQGTPIDIAPASTSETDAAEMAQITSVSQLADVLPTDWSYAALRSLIQRYGCVQGYPDQTFRGDLPLSRFEFAAVLNACLDTLTAQLNAITAASPQKSDLEALTRLVENFAPELEQLRNKVVALGTRLATLESQQFSPTTRLSGSTIFAIASPLVQGDRFDEQTNFGYRTRLNFNTSFGGRDLLRVRFESGDTPAFELGQLPLSFGSNTRGSIRLQKLFYSFQVGDFANVEIGGAGYALVDVITSPISPTAFGLGETGNLYKTL